MQNVNIFRVRFCIVNLRGLLKLSHQMLSSTARVRNPFSTLIHQDKFATILRKCLNRNLHEVAATLKEYLYQRAKNYINPNNNVNPTLKNEEALS
jgi:hypothetical protein